MALRFPGRKRNKGAVLGHVRWLPGQRDPIVFLNRSFDGRRSWEPWTPSAIHGGGPVTEGVVVELPDSRIYVYDVYAYHTAGETFTGRRWLSRDGLRSLEPAEEITVRVPGIATSGQIDDRGEAVNRLYIRRSMLRLPSGDLLACAYGRFRWDTAKVEYLPTMNQSSSYLLRSADEGRSWQLLSIIATSPLGQEGAGEPVLVRVSHGPNAGRLICQMRVGREHAVWQAESDDDGRTWTAARPLRWTYSRFGRSREIVGVDPDLTEMADGTLVMSYGHKIDYQDDGNFLAFSLDHGATWTAETRLSSTMTVAYTGVREVAPGELFVVYTTTDEHRVQGNTVEPSTRGGSPPWAARSGSAAPPRHLSRNRAAGGGVAGKRASALPRRKAEGYTAGPGEGPLIPRLFPADEFDIV